MDPAWTTEDRLPPGIAFEAERALNRRERDSASAQALVEGHIGERTREHLGFAKRLRHLKRGARASFGCGNVAEYLRSPGKAPLDLDPQPDVIPHLGERRLEELRADVKALPERANPGEPGERTGTSASTRRCGDDLLEQRPRPLRLACLEVAFGGLDPPSVRLVYELAGGEAASLFPQCRRRVRGAAGPRLLGGLVQLRRHGTVGTLGREREMPSAFLRIFENGGKALVEPAPLRRCCVRVEHGCQERVSEVHAIAVDLEHAGIDRLREPGGAALPVCGSHDEFGCGTLEHRDGQSDFARRWGKAGKSLTYERAQVVGNGERLARGQRYVALEDAPRDLEGEEGSAARGGMEQQERGTMELGIEAGAEKPIQCFDTERADGQPLEAVFR